MLVTLASALVAGTCALASARALAHAVAPTSLHVGVLSEALAGDDAAPLSRKIGRALGVDARFAWERDLFDAFLSIDHAAKGGLVNELLLDLEGRVERWARVPRVSASIATSAGFLFASLGLLRGLAVAEGEDIVVVREALASAMAALTFGVAGASFCIAVHVRAGRVRRERLAATDRLVERLEVLARGRQPV